MSNDESEVDYQIGEHNVDTESVEMGDETEFFEFEFEERAVFNRLAKSIYAGREAGVREPLANAYAAVIRAQEEYDLGETEGVVEVTLKGEDELIIQDNGIGITKEVLKEVVAVIGRSTNRNRKSLSGKFGMGFLAIWMLVGLSGGFIMHTNSRKENTEPISGVWKNGGFSRSPTEEFDSSMDDDQYGTRFEIKLVDGISKSHIRRWVSKHSKWARVPVIYREFDKDGKEVFNEDYGNNDITDKLDDKTPRVIIDREHFKAVNYPNFSSDGDTILLDVQIKRNKSLSNAPYRRTDIRLKTESNIVIDGPNEGLIPINRNEYKEKENKEEYIPNDKLDTDDIVLPSPTGTRDRLENREKFWDWLGDKLTEKYENSSIETFQKLDSVNDLYELSLDKLGLIINYSEKISATKKDDFIPSLTSIGLSEEIATEIDSLRTSVTIKKSNSENQLDGDKDTRTRAYMPEWNVKNNGGTIYVGVSINPKKAQVVFQDNSNNYVIQIENTDFYDMLEPLGWKKLKNINKSTIDTFDVPEKLKNHFKETKKSRKDPGQKTLTLHFSKRDATNVKKKASEIKELFNTPIQDRDDLGYYQNPKRLITFPSNSDYSISNNYWMATKNTAITKCTVNVYEYLTENENIFHVEDYINRAKELGVQTQSGYMKMKNLPSNAVIHIVQDRFYNEFSNEEYMDKYAKYLEEQVMTDNNFGATEMDYVFYCVIPESDYSIAAPALYNRKYLIGDSQIDKGIGEKTTLSYDTELYAYGRLYDWKNTKELNQLLEMSCSLSDGGYDLIETLAEIHDDGKPPNSKH